MKNLITVVSIAVLLTACGGGGSSEDTTSAAVDTTPAVVNDATNNTDTGANPDTGSTDVASNDQTPENTTDLETTAEFGFETARAIAIDFDVEQARTSPGLMSLCTKYTSDGDSYDIDYDSCTVQTPLVNGVYSGEMNVTNDISSVVGVVWFKDEAVPPVYKEFSLAVGARLARRGEGIQTIRW